MNKSIFKKLVSAGLSAAMLTFSIPSAPATFVQAADQQVKGNINGYDYEMWNQNYTGQASMNPSAGSFTCSWSGIENFLARMGKNYDSKKQNYKQIGSDIVLTYDVEYTPRGNSYMCVYGWTRNPLMEYYIVEGWGDWRPPGDGAERKGQVSLNGNTYDICKTMRYNQPSLDGTATFPQYWSIRQTSGSQNNTTNYMKGTINVSKHFDAWSKAGLDMSGTLYEVSLNIEGYRSNGQANVKSVRVYENGLDNDPYPDIPKKVAEPDENGDYFTNDFESGAGSWTARGNASVTSDSSNYYDGAKSIYVTDRANEWNGCAISLDPDTFVAGETYSFSAAVLQTSGSNVTLQMSLQQGDGNGASYTKIADCTAKSGEWTKLEETEFTIPSNSGDMTLYIETPESSGDLCDFYVDAVQVSKSGKASSVVTGKGTVGTPSSGNQEENNNQSGTGSGNIDKSQTIKIMPVGDSITNGDGEQGGYRKYLYDALTKKGYKIDMVGPNGRDSATANGITYDDNHAGFSGYQIKEVPSWGQQQGGKGSLYNELKNNNAVKKADPDIILLMIGTNDLTANRSMDACASDLRAMLDYMLADMSSDGVIFLASVPEHTAYGGNTQKIANYNNTVKSVAEEYAGKGKNVKFADVHSCLDGMNDISGDQLHPNGTGYKKIGNFWAETLDDFVTASQAAVTTTTTTTSSNARYMSTTPTVQSTRLWSMTAIRTKCRRNVGNTTSRAISPATPSTTTPRMSPRCSSPSTSATTTPTATGSNAPSTNCSATACFPTTPPSAPSSTSRMKVGFVNIIGNPNVGKSTLMNALVGERLSIITSKAQTTRKRVMGIVNGKGEANGDDFQIVYTDTPGIVNPHNKLHEQMMGFVGTALQDADLFLLVTEVGETFKNRHVLERVINSDIPVILVINKIDLSDQATINEKIAYWQSEIPRAVIVPCSATEGFNVDRIFDLILERLPEHPAYFPTDELTDRTMRFFVSEIVREKILLYYQKEIPYSCEVAVEAYEEKDGIDNISCLIFVERESQKAILIGHQGKAIKKLGIEARKDIEEFTGKRCFLSLHIKVLKDWRNSDRALKSFGYSLED